MSTVHENPLAAHANGEGIPGKPQYQCHLRLDLLTPLDQRAVRCAASGEKWAIIHLRGLSPDRQLLADHLLIRYFATTFASVISA